MSHSPLVVVHRRGFTLVEVVVALAIVVTGALSLAGLSASAATIVARSRRTSEAVWLADGGVTHVQSRDLATAPESCLLQDSDGCVRFIDGLGQPTTDPRAPFSVRWSITRFTTGPDAAVIVACAVPAAERAATVSPAGTCVARLAMAGVP